MFCAFWSTEYYNRAQDSIDRNAHETLGSLYFVHSFLFLFIFPLSFLSFHLPYFWYLSLLCVSIFHKYFWLLHVFREYVAIIFKLLYPCFSLHRLTNSPFLPCLLWCHMIFFCIYCSSSHGCWVLMIVTTMQYSEDSISYNSIQFWSSYNLCLFFSILALDPWCNSLILFSPDHWSVTDSQEFDE